MSDTKPGRILAERSENPWVKLILWSNEDKELPTRRWNGFIKHLLELKLARFKDSGLTDEQQRALMEHWGIDRVEFKRVVPLRKDELNKAKKFFPGNTDFTAIHLNVKIDNYTFSMELNFSEAIIAGSISFNNCLFVRTVNFGRANFENGATFMHSKFLKPVNFGKAQCRGSFAFYSVTFHKGVIFIVNIITMFFCGFCRCKIY